MSLQSRSVTAEQIRLVDAVLRRPVIVASAITAVSGAAASVGIALGALWLLVPAAVLIVVVGLRAVGEGAAIGAVLLLTPVIQIAVRQSFAPIPLWELILPLLVLATIHRVGFRIS